MLSRRSLSVLVLVASLVVVAGGPVAARPPPAPVCDVCTGQLAAAAADHGVDVRPGESRLSIQVFKNGSARWSARIDLTATGEQEGRETTVRRTDVEVSGSTAIESLRTDDALRNEIVASVQDRNVLGTPVNVTSTVSNETLIVNYRRPDAVERSGDALVFTSFHADNPNRDVPLYAGADEITLRSPEGYRITSGPTGDTVTANETVAIWSELTEESDNWEGPTIDYTKVTFAPTDGAAANAPRGENTGGVLGFVDTPLLVLGGVVVFVVGLVLLQYCLRVVFLRSERGPNPRK